MAPYVRQLFQGPQHHFPRQSQMRTPCSSDRSKSSVNQLSWIAGPCSQVRSQVLRRDPPTLPAPSPRILMCLTTLPPITGLAQGAGAHGIAYRLPGCFTARVALSCARLRL